jgi:hypothetical protein
MSQEQAAVIALGIVTFVLITGCAILLARTASGMLNSRFLRHLATSLAINAAGALVFVVCFSLTATLKFFQGKVMINDPNAISFPQALNMVNSVWTVSGTMISLLSNAYLFMAWDLLRRYPNQGVKKSLFVALVAIFGTGSLLVMLINLLTIVEKLKEHLGQVITFIDLVSSATGVLLVGWQLQKTLGPKIENPVLKMTLPWLTFMAYFIWGGGQLLHHWFKGLLWYSTLLSASSLSAVVMTILLCSYALKEKSKYSSNGASG